jgi:hypothetical protein
MARTADEHVALRPGTDAAFYNGMLHVIARDGLTDERFIAEHTVGWEAVRDTVAAYTPERVGGICGLDPRQVERVAHLWGRARRCWAAHGRGLEQHLQGVENVLSCINVTLATGQIGRPGAGYGTLTGQGNGQGGREHGQKSDMLPGGRDISNLEHRAYVAGVWGVEEADLPPKGTSMHEMIRQMADGEIRGLLGMCNNPFVSLPNQAVVRAGYDALEFHVQSDFFLSETAARADVVLPSTVWAEDEGLTTNGEGRGGQAQQGGGAARGGPHRLGDPVRVGPPARVGRQVRLHPPLGDPGRAAGRLQGRVGRLLRHHLREGRGDRRGVLALSHPGPPGHPAAVRGRPLLPPRRQGPLPRRRVAAPGRAARRGVPAAADHRAHRRPLPVRQPDPPAAPGWSSRRPGPGSRSTPRWASPTATWCGW